MFDPEFIHDLELYELRALIEETTAEYNRRIGEKQEEAIRAFRKAFYELNELGIELRWENGTDNVWCSGWKGFHYYYKENEVDPFKDDREEW